MSQIIPLSFHRSNLIFYSRTTWLFIVAAFDMFCDALLKTQIPSLSGFFSFSAAPSNMANTQNASTNSETNHNVPSSCLSILSTPFISHIRCNRMFLRVIETNISFPAERLSCRQAQKIFEFSWRDYFPKSFSSKKFPADLLS